MRDEIKAIWIASIQEAKVGVGCRLLPQTLLVLTILLRSLASMRGAGSRLVSGELLGEPVDMGESTAGTLLDGTTGSRNGFFDLVGDEKGLERPMVANFWPAKGLLAWPGEEVNVEFGEGVGRKDEEVEGGTKFCVKGLVVLLLTVLHCSALGRSLNRVSLCTPACPLEEKWVTETGRSIVREERSSRLLGVEAGGGDSTWGRRKEDGGSGSRILQFSAS